ncbi:MAG: response regulator transcription factor [Bdellovibrionota bacterium]
MESALNILLIDDDVFVRQALRVILRGAFPDAVITEGESLEEGLSLLGTSTWSLVVLDLALGSQSGLSIIHQAALSQLPVPILVLSSQKDPSAAIAAIRAGARGFLTKTEAAESARLVDAIQKVLSGGRYVSQALASVLVDELDGDQQPLSAQENRVLFFIADGKSVKEIAHLLSVSEKTIRTYRTRLLEKLHLSTDGEIIRYAIQHGIVK